MLSVLVFLFIFEIAFGLDNGLGVNHPPMGWNTWCQEGPCGNDRCYEHEIKAVADALVEQGLHKLGFEYINLDDCWADKRGPNGEIQADPTRFPNGMKATADYLHERGLKFGLYTDSGTLTCSDGGRNHTIPGSYMHYQQDAKTYASWGIDYVKMDWCHTVVDGVQLNPKQVYAEMSRALQATGRQIWFLACEWGYEKPWFWGRKYLNSWRATTDHHDNWENTAGIIEQVSSPAIASQSGPTAYNYLDFLMTGGQGGNCGHTRCPGMTDTEYFTEYSMWVMANSPLIVATDLIDMTPLQKTILTNPHFLALHQDRLARSGYRVGYGPAHCKHCEVWARQLWNGDLYVAFYNSGPSEAHFEFDANLVGWANATIHPFDLWAKKPLAPFVNSFQSRVPSHGVHALRLSLDPKKAD